MIFSNNGMTQVGGNAVEIATDLSTILRTVRLRSQQMGMSAEFGDEVIVFAGRLSMMSEYEQNEFFNSLPKEELLTFHDIFQKFDEYSRRKER